MDEVEELRRWSAELVGLTDYGLAYYEWPSQGETTKVILKKDWRPDDPTTGQIWLIVEKMRELGWYFSICAWPKHEFIAQFIESEGSYGNIPMYQATNPNPCLAILRAARAARAAMGG